jgi:hypothetical protein
VGPALVLLVVTQVRGYYAHSGRGEVQADDGPDRRTGAVPDAGPGACGQVLGLWPGYGKLRKAQDPQAARADLAEMYYRCFFRRLFRNDLALCTYRHMSAVIKIVL